MASDFRFDSLYLACVLLGLVLHILCDCLIGVLKLRPRWPLLLTSCKADSGVSFSRFGGFFLVIAVYFLPLHNACKMMNVFLCVCVCVFVCVCVYVCLSLFMCVFLCLCLCVYECVSECMCVFLCLCVSFSVDLLEKGFICEKIFETCICL